MKRKAFRAGFTLIELSLSLVFISLLSLAIVLIIMNTISSYRRGLTLGQLNSTGAELVDDFRVAVQNSSAESINAMCAAKYGGTSGSAKGAYDNCLADNARNFVYIVKNASVEFTDGTAINVPVFGAFCSGSYSYIWNSGYFFSDDVKEITGFAGVLADDNTAFSGVPVRQWYGDERPRGSARLWYRNSQNELVDVAGFRLLKVKDETRQVCISKATGGDGNNYRPFAEGTTMKENVFDISFAKSQFMEEAPVEILNTGENGDMAIYDFTIAAPAEGGGGSKMFYAGSFILGTIRGGPNIRTADSTCATPDEVLSDFDYCAINRFNFAAETGGE